MENSIEFKSEPDLIILQSKPTVRWNGSFSVFTSEDTGSKRTPCRQTSPVIRVQRKKLRLNLHQFNQIKQSLKQSLKAKSIKFRSRKPYAWTTDYTPAVQRQVQQDPVSAQLHTPQ